MTLDQAIQDAARQADATYWRIRERLLPQYNGKWIVLDGEAVVSSASNPLDAMRAASAAGTKTGYLQLVGREHEVVVRARRSVIPYDTIYPLNPIPRASIFLCDEAKTRRAGLDGIVLDTGADVTYVQQRHCREAGLTGGYQSLTQRYGQPPEVLQFYSAVVEFAGRELPSMVVEVADSQEELLGRDVLNQFRITFDGPGRRTIVD